MNLESSRTIVSLTDLGSDLMIEGSRDRTPSITATVFSPMARRMSSWIAGLSPYHTDEVGRSKASSA